MTLVEAAACVCWLDRRDPSCRADHGDGGYRLVWHWRKRLPERKGQPRDWVMPMLDQVTAFAGKGSVEHDDFLDCMCQALLYLHDRDMLVPLPPKEDPDVLLEREARKAQAELNREKGSINPYSQ